MNHEHEGLLRELVPQVLGALFKRYGQFDLCEDAVQEALLQASEQWPNQGRPVNPKGWLVTVGSRRLMDQMRSEHSRREREATVYLTTPQAARVSEVDDSLDLLFLCCHPDLSLPSQVALTLRAVGGLTTAQIAHAFLVPEATMAQRISRAKQTIKDKHLGTRGSTSAIANVLYLIFNEGYTATTGDDLTAPQLSNEAIRLTRMLHKLVPGDSEVTGLLALTLLTDARRTARTAPDGSLVPLSEQDRRKWNQELIAEGIALVAEALPKGQPGPYQIQAAIAALHGEAAAVEETDWPQILALYDILRTLTPGPMVELNRAVALAMVHGPRAGLKALGEISGLGKHHRLLATRAHLLELAGDRAQATAAYMEAARRATSLPERRYLALKAQAHQVP